MVISKLDHFVLTVKDINQSISFYTSVLGMEKVIFDQDRVALRYGNEKINLHESRKEFEPKAGKPTPGSGDLCFITNTPLKEAMAHIESKGIKIIEGPLERTGANGKIMSFYVRDPNLNLIEVANPI